MCNVSENFDFDKFRPLMAVDGSLCQLNLSRKVQ